MDKLEIKDVSFGSILYPTQIRHEDKADKFLVSHCEFIDFAREMVNIKIDEDLQKDRIYIVN